MSVAPPHVVVRHEIEVALERCFPGLLVPGPFQFLGSGFAHAADHKGFAFRLEWPPETKDIPAPQRKAIEGLSLAMAEYSLLSGVLPTGDTLPLGPPNLTPDRRFKAGLDEWRGVASRYPAAELERRIYAITLNDISNMLCEVLAQHKIPVQGFALLGEPRWCEFLDDMPSRRADMHLRRQWARNAGLTPKDSDLNDWAYLGVEVSYCDIVVTDKQVADLFSRGLGTSATVVAQLGELLEMVA